MSLTTKNGSMISQEILQEKDRSLQTNTEATNNTHSIYNTTELSLDSQTLINWSSYNHIYSIVSAYGGPSYILPTNSYFVLGTIKGPLLIFNYKEFLQAILLPQTKDEIPSSSPSSTSSSSTIGTNSASSLITQFSTALHSKVMDITMSYDGTHLAASYESGDVYLWNLNSSSNKQDHLDQINDNDNSSNVMNSSSQRIMNPTSALLHITEHKGLEITGIDFMEKRHTGLIVSNATGNILCHNGHRTSFWKMTYSVKKILIIATNEIILNTSLNGDRLAILTNIKFGIISAQHNSEIIFEENIENNSINNLTVPQTSMVWIHDSIAYSIKNNIVVYFNTSQMNRTKLVWNYTEPILSIQWLTPELLGLLSVSHQLLIVNPSENFNIIMNIDLLVHELLIPPNKHFKWYRNKLFLLTNYSFKVGKFVSWSSILLKRVQMGNYIGALSLLNQFADKDFPIPTLLNLTNDVKSRKAQLKDPFNNLTFAALKYLLNNNRTEGIDDLITMAIRIQRSWFPNESKEVIFQFLDITWETILQQSDEITIQLQDIFLHTVNKLIQSKVIESLSPLLFQAILKKYPESLKTLVSQLEEASWDYDLLIRSCQEQHDVITLTYIWNVSFKDYLTPLVETLKWLRDGKLNDSEIFGQIEIDQGKPNFIYDYIVSVYNGLQFPTSSEMGTDKAITLKKCNMSYILFNGVDIYWPLNSNKKLETVKKSFNQGAEDIPDEPPFPYLMLLMHHQPRLFFDMLENIIEDPLFDEVEDPLARENQIESTEHTLKVSKQNVMDILVNLYYDHNQRQLTVEFQYMVIFIISTLVKYDNQILVASETLEKLSQDIFDISQGLEGKTVDIETLIIDFLTIYIPQAQQEFILKLKTLNFIQALFVFYKKTSNYVEMIHLYISNPKINSMVDDAFETVIVEANQKLEKSSNEFVIIKDLVRNNLEKVIDLIGISKTVEIIQMIDPTLHQEIMRLSFPEDVKLEYLEMCFSGSFENQTSNSDLKKYYIGLSCKLKNKEELISWLKNIKLDISTTDILVTELSLHDNYEALAVIYNKMGNHVEEIDYLIKSLQQWFSKSNPPQYDLDRLIAASIGSIFSLKGEKRQYWIKLISCLMNEFSTHKDNKLKQKMCGNILEKVFFRLLVIERKDGNNLYQILIGVLEDHGIIVTKVKDIKEILTQIFTSYHLEKEISELLLKIVQDSSLDMVNVYLNELQEGWTIYNSECEVCGKKLWGVGLSPVVYHQWEDKQRNLVDETKSFVYENLVLFKCCHGFHKKCLKNLGQKEETFQCILCDPKNK